MARRLPLSEVQPGYYYARVGEARYEVRAVPERTRRPVRWDLYRVVDGEEEFLGEAPTLEHHRRTLEALLGELGEMSCRCPTPPVPREVMQWTDLAEDVALAAEQARQIELPLVQRALAIAERAVARHRGIPPVAASPVSQADVLTGAGESLEAEADRLHDLAVSLEIARDQARRVGAVRGTIGCALGVAIRGVDARADQILDAVSRLEAAEETRVPRGGGVMAHQGGLKELEAGHYSANVGGALYEVIRQRARRGIAWDLYRVVDGARELVHQAETLGEHREMLAVIGAFLSEPAGASPNAPRPRRRARPEDADHASQPNTNVVDLETWRRRRAEGREHGAMLTEGRS